MEHLVAGHSEEENYFCDDYLVFARTTPVEVIKELEPQQDQHEEVVGVDFGSSYL